MSVSCLLFYFFFFTFLEAVEAAFFLAAPFFAVDRAGFSGFPLVAPVDEAAFVLGEVAVDLGCFFEFAADVVFAPGSDFFDGFEVAVFFSDVVFAVFLGGFCSSANLLEACSMSSGYSGMSPNRERYFGSVARHRIR